MSGRTAAGGPRHAYKLRNSAEGGAAPDSAGTDGDETEDARAPLRPPDMSDAPDADAASKETLVAGEGQPWDAGASPLRRTLVVAWLRMTFFFAVMVPAAAMVLGRGVLGIYPRAVHLSYQNMFLSCVMAFAVCCWRASFVTDVQYMLPLLEFGAYFYIALVVTLWLYTFGFAKTLPPPDQSISLAPYDGLGMVFSSLYVTVLALLTTLLRFPNPPLSLVRSLPSLPSFFATYPRRLLSGRPLFPRLFGLGVVLLIFVPVVGYLLGPAAPGYRWFPYGHPEESVMAAFFASFSVVAAKAVPDLYGGYVLFAEFWAAMGFLHGFAMSLDSINATQGNSGWEHVMVGDVLLMWCIGLVLSAYHPAIGNLATS